MNDSLLNKIINAVDSDDLLIMASDFDVAFNKDKANELKKMLKQVLVEKKLNHDDACAVRQFLLFLS